MGLKEAKDAVDALQTHGMITTNELPFPAQADIKELAQFRIRVHTESSSLQLRLKQLLVAAVKADEFELSEELLAIYKRHYTA